jgi:hypothetical protein
MAEKEMTLRQSKEIALHNLHFRRRKWGTANDYINAYNRNCVDTLFEDQPAALDTPDGEWLRRFIEAGERPTQV